MIDHQQRVRNAESTDQLIRALNALTSADFDKMFGSGILVSLTPITEHERFTGEFCIPAETMREVAPPLIKSLQEHLVTRRVALLCQVSCINDALRAMENQAP